jgi:hypothetical protein
VKAEETGTIENCLIAHEDKLRREKGMGLKSHFLLRSEGGIGQCRLRGMQRPATYPQLNASISRRRDTGDASAVHRLQMPQVEN